MADEPATEVVGREGEEVLLYYKYMRLDAAGAQTAIQAWLQERCAALALRGRVRVARDGLNVTLTGASSALKEHMAEVSAHPLVAADGRAIDFKLAPAEPHPLPAVTLETGMDTLSVKLCKEVVSLGPRAGPLAADLAHTADHVSGKRWKPLASRAPAELAVELRATRGGGAAAALAAVSPQEFHALLTDAGTAAKPRVLLDVRNLYESRIGRFCAEGVPTMAPPLRAFSGFPEWVEDNAAHLCGKQLLLYCTGGVRCERASAFIKHLGEGFEDVKQLEGGIHRYLEAFPDGGAFRGKNFVFDERCAVAAPDAPSILGECALCAAPYDDYRARSRCAYCRMLMCVCDRCRIATPASAEPLTCELCAANPAARARPRIGPPPPPPTRAPPPPPGRARVLCLHGFRQSARQLGGRLHSLRRRLQHVAELMFMDAPHLLPNYYTPADDTDMELSSAADRAHGNPSAAEAGPSSSAPPANAPKRPRRAWLVTPGAELLDAAVSSAGLLRPLPSHCLSSEQHHEQTEGWGASLKAIQAFWSTHGPFDGVLGFSQGCATAAVLCAMQSAGSSPLPPIKFAILCSGYASYAPEHRALFDKVAPMPLPSLHIFGTEGNDRQIDTTENEELLRLFSAEGRVVVRHGAGHIVPTGKTLVAQYARFLEPFMQPPDAAAAAAHVSSPRPSAADPERKD